MRTVLIVGALAASTASILFGVWHFAVRLEAVLMANFDQLNASLDAQNTAIEGVKTRLAEDVQALRDQIAALELDTDDQAKVDAVVARVQANVDTLNGIDAIPPVTPAEPTPVDPNAPVEPVQP